MAWILFLFIKMGYGESVTTIEFPTKEACERAAIPMQAAYSVNAYLARATCINHTTGEVETFAASK